MKFCNRDICSQEGELFFSEGSFCVLSNKNSPLSGMHGMSSIESVGLVNLVKCLDNDHDEMPKL